MYRCFILQYLCSLADSKVTGYTKDINRFNQIIDSLKTHLPINLKCGDVINNRIFNHLPIKR